MTTEEYTKMYIWSRWIEKMWTLYRCCTWQQRRSVDNTCTVKPV